MSKRCNCKQSRCIKLYCECYANGVYCSGCHCVSCLNNNVSEAFQPKISVTTETKQQDPLNLGKHNKGCACKKSGCMKKYCECFQAAVPCSDNCKCSDCHNTGFFSQQNLLKSVNNQDDPNDTTFLIKLLLANDEDHLNTILNGNKLNQQQKGVSIQNEVIQETCEKLLKIINLSEHKLLEDKNVQQKLEEMVTRNEIQSQGSKFQTPQKNKKEEEINIENDNNQVIKQQSGEKTPIQSSRIEDEINNQQLMQQRLLQNNSLENIKDGEQQNQNQKTQKQEHDLENDMECEDEKMEIQDLNQDNQNLNDENANTGQKDKKVSLFNLKKVLILDKFLSILRSVEEAMNVEDIPKQEDQMEEIIQQQAIQLLQLQQAEMFSQNQIIEQEEQKII